MEFWGTEVLSGKGQLNEPGEDTYVHVSQAALGPSKDGKVERVVIRVESGGKNVVLGTLTTGKVDQMTLDLIFDREFKLSHSSTSSSVFFCGYRTDKQQDYDEESDEEEGDEEDEESDEDDEPVPVAVPIKQNGTVSAKVVKKQSKVTEVVDTKAKKIEAAKPSLVDEEADEGEASDEDDEDEDEDGDLDTAMRLDFDTDDYNEEDDSEFEVDDESGSEVDSDEEDDDDSEDEDDTDEDDEDDEVDVAAELGKKRSLQESAKKAPVEGKKPRLDTPAKPGSQTAAEYWESLIIAGRKGLINSLGKKGAKAVVEKSTPASTKKSESKGSIPKTPQKTPAKTPKSEKTATPGAGESAKKIGPYHCSDCARNFTAESALSQHNSAKHKQ